MSIYPEEALGCRYAHIHNGLYPKSSANYINQANYYWSSVHGKDLIGTGTILKKKLLMVYTKSLEDGKIGKCNIFFIYNNLR